MRMHRVLVVTLLSSTGLQAQAPTCGRIAPAGAAAFDLARVSDLAGSYNLSLIDTTGAATRRIGYDMVLWPNDSIRRYQYVGQPGRIPGERPLGGTARAQDMRYVHFREWTGRDNVGWSIGFIGKDLRMGTIDELDGWGSALSVGWVSPAGFGGTWTSHSGIAVTVDSLGRRLPDPAGYFCAVHVPRFPDAPRPP